MINVLLVGLKSVAALKRPSYMPDLKGYLDSLKDA